MIRARNQVASVTLFIAAAGLVSLADLSISSPSFAADAHCDQELRTDPLDDNPYGYRTRGDRCEGVYVKELSSTTLLVTSWTSFFEDYDLSSGEALLVEWKSPDDDIVKLRASGLRRQLYYRMDSARPPGTESYAWPSDILAALHIPAPELGVVGWTKHDVSGTEQILHLPLTISQGRKPAWSGSYQMNVLPGRELTEVFVSLSKIDKSGHPEKIISDGVPLGYGYYPADRNISILIEDLEGPGIYDLEIGALMRGGGVTNLDFWFFHPGS